MKKSHEIILKILIALLIIGGLAVIVDLVLPIENPTFGDGAVSTVLKIALGIYDACCISVLVLGWRIVTLCKAKQAFSLKTASVLAAAADIAIISSALFAVANVVTVDYFAFSLDMFTVCRILMALIGFIVLAFGTLLKVVAVFVKDASEMQEELEGVV